MRWRSVARWLAAHCRVSGRLSNVPPERAALFRTKFSTADVESTRERLLRLHPNANVWILTDGYVPPPAGNVIDCREHDPVSLDAVVGECPLFIYACDVDDIGLPWIRELVRRCYRFYPVAAYTPSTYAHVRELARTTLESEFAIQTEEGFSKWDFGAGDFLNIVQAIDITRSIGGDYVEIGCYRGSSGSVAMRYMHARALTRTCYFFDTFDGFSYDAARSSSDAIWVDTHGTEGEEAVRARLERYANPAHGLHVVVEKRNIIESDLPAGIERIALANVDVDLYEAVQAALFKVAPLVVPRGIIIVEDPGHTPALIGSRLALEDFVASDLGACFVPIQMESGQTLLIRMWS